MGPTESGQTATNGLTVDRLLVRLAALEEERARLQQEYARLGAQLQAQLGQVRPTTPAAPDQAPGAQPGHPCGQEGGA